jgi:hypothetical protein
MTLSQMKHRYVVHVVEKEETFRAAAKVLDIDPATACRIFNGKGDRDKSNGATPRRTHRPGKRLKRSA